MAAGVDVVVESAVEIAEPVDVEINNAAVLFSEHVVDIDMQTSDRIFAVGLESVVRATQKVLPHMREQGIGRIINISLNAAHVPRVGVAAYKTAKTAVTHMTRGTASENPPFGVTANLVAPGPTSTDISNSLWGSGDKSRIVGIVRGVREEFRLGMPIGRKIHPVEQTHAVVFFADPNRARSPGRRSTSTAASTCRDEF